MNICGALLPIGNKNNIWGVLEGGLSCKVSHSASMKSY